MWVEILAGTCTGTGPGVRIGVPHRWGGKRSAAPHRGPAGVCDARREGFGWSAARGRGWRPGLAAARRNLAEHRVKTRCVHPGARFLGLGAGFFRGGTGGQGRRCTGSTIREIAAVLDGGGPSPRAGLEPGGGTFYINRLGEPARRHGSGPPVRSGGGALGAPRIWVQAAAL